MAKKEVELNFTVWIKLWSKQRWHSLNIIVNECKLRKRWKRFLVFKKTHSIDEYLLPIIYHFIWQIIVWINFTFHSKRCQTAFYHLAKYREIIMIVSRSSLNPSFKWLFFQSVNKNVWLQKRKLQTIFVRMTKFQLLSIISSNSFSHDANVVLTLYQDLKNGFDIASMLS